MEAEGFLSSGYVTRLEIQSKPTGWKPVADIARTWQPTRLKGIQVGREYGTPFLAATQVFDVRPIPRKWLSLDRTDNVAIRFVQPGTILLTCSGSVGRATLALSTIDGMLISHDLLRIEPRDSDWWGWIYAYLRAPIVRRMLESAQYGHIIKHLETSHVDALPIIVVPSSQRKRFADKVRTVLKKRDEAFRLTLEAEGRYEAAFGEFEADDFGETGFVRRVSGIIGNGRRRFDAWHYNPALEAIVSHLDRRATEWSGIAELGFNVWLPSRFRRIAAKEGVPFLDSANLFEINPDIKKRIADKDFGDTHNGRVKQGWILLARSGQIYGLNGSAMISGKCHEDKIVSDHIIRMAPNKSTCRIGYLLTAMTHPTLGRPRVKALPYGSSIPEIEIADLLEFRIPRLNGSIESSIADCAERAAELRDESDELEMQLADDANAIVTSFLSRKA